MAVIPMCSGVQRALTSLPALALLIGLLSGVVVLAVRGSGALEPVELFVYDWLLRLKPVATIPDSRVVLVAVTEQDIRNQGRYPLTDATLARILSRIMQGNPRAVGVDIYRDIEVPPGRDELDTLLASHSHIICVTKYGGDGGVEIPPPPVVAGTEQVGFNDLVPDPGMVIRRALLFQDHGEEVGHSFALRLAEVYLRGQGIFPEPDPLTEVHMKLGKTTFVPFRPSDGGYVDADAGGYQLLLNYESPRAISETVTVTGLLDGKVDPGVFEGKIVLVGVTAESVADRVNTPYGMIRGVEIHALIIDQILDAALEGRGPVATLSENQEMAWILAWGLLGGFLGWWAHSPFRVLVGMPVGILLIAGVGAVALWDGWWVPLVAPALAWSVPTSFVTASVVQRERQERALLRQLFGRHVSEEVAEALWEQRNAFLEEGRPRVQEHMATVLFADFTGFTAVSEKLEPRALLAWVNSYLEAMSHAVIEHHGHVDDYAGDAIKANFFDVMGRLSGRAESRDDVRRDAINAVRCALAMEDVLGRLNEGHRTQGVPTVGMRIGVHTGPVVSGAVGSARRMKYTTVGDTVNTASRLESFDRESMVGRHGAEACRILVGEATAREIGNEFRVDAVGDLQVRGKEHAISVFRVMRDDRSS